MKKLLIFILLIVSVLSFGQTTTQNKNVDPIGTYKLAGKTNKKNGEVYGYFGQIQIRKLSTEKIIVAFEICKGAPSYNSGSFIDTLDYNVNKAVYKPGEKVDLSCEITFVFTSKGILVDEKANDFNFGCGFGHGVIAYGFFKKVSSKEPVIIYKYGQAETSTDSIINSIKKQYQFIQDNLKSYDTAKIEAPATAYYEGSEIKLIVFGEAEKNGVDYYFSNGQLFFAIDYNFDKNKNGVVSNRYYFSNGKLILWLDNDQKKVNLSLGTNSIAGQGLKAHSSKIKDEFKK